MQMELTEMYFKILHKAEEKANYLHFFYNSWQGVQKAVQNAVSYSTWRRVGKGSLSDAPRIETLAAMADCGPEQMPRRYNFTNDMHQLKRMCKRKLAALKEEYGLEGLAEKLGVDVHELEMWLSIYDIFVIPEFRCLLTIDYLFVIKEELL